MDMIATVNEFEKCVNITMEKAKAKLKDELFEDSFDSDGLDFVKDLFHMCDLAMRLVKEQATTIQNINEKLDKLLERT